MVDPLTGIGAVANILGTATGIMKEIKPARPEAKSLTIRCPEGVAEFSAMIRPRKLRRDMKVKFATEKILKLHVHTLPDFVNHSEVVTAVGHNLTLDLGRLSELSDSAILIVEYEVEREDVLHTLVASRWKADTIGVADDDKYWMQTQLKHVAALETDYGTVDLRDVEVSVNVGIYQHLRTALPQELLRRIDTLGAVITEQERGKRARLMMQYLALRKAKSSAYDLRKVAQLRKVFTTRNFRRFIDVDPPFLYSAAYPGQMGLGSGGALDLPKFVEVVARTDLGLKKPAAEGYLVHKARELGDHLIGLFKSS